MASGNTINIEVDAHLTPLAARLTALDMACRVVPEGDSVGHFLSTARSFETYLATGLVRTGGNWQAAVEIGAEGVSVTVEAPGLAPEVTERLRTAVAGVLGQPQPDLTIPGGRFDGPVA